MQNQQHEFFFFSLRGSSGMGAGLGVGPIFGIFIDSGSDLYPSAMSVSSASVTLCPVLALPAK